MLPFNSLEDYIELHFDEVYQDLVDDGLSHDEAKTLGLEIIEDMFRERECWI